MTLHFYKRLSSVMLAALAAGCVVGCGNGGSGGKDVADLPDLPGSPDDPVAPDPGDPTPDPASQCNATPACDNAISVDAAGPALLVTDPTVLAEFPIEKVLTHILQFQGIDPDDVAPAEALARLFDTMNNDAGGKFDDVAHCDSPDNPATINKNGDTFMCPRPEGELAYSAGLMTAGDPDSFFPVAVINRFDLTPVDGSRCGQYRIIYAKHSGLTDPDNRVFMIFEAALANPNPGCLESCRPVASFWKNLEGKAPDEIATNLRTFFFAGIPGFKPAIHPLHYGFGAQDQGYGGTEPGQIRVSMHMKGGEWDMRELHVDQDPTSGAPRFSPATVKNNPPPYLFDPAAEDIFGMGQVFRDMFMFNGLFPLAGQTPDGKQQELWRVQMFTSPEFNGVESLLGGERKNDYFVSATAQGNMSFVEAIQLQIDQQGLSAACPSGDPLDAEAVLKRASALSCAGCHAPKDFLGEDRSIGCGMTWPDSVGQTHVNENRELSPALKDVFLPRRAEVLRTFLQACDMNALLGGLQPGQPGGGIEEGQPSPPSDKPQQSQAGRTLGGSRTH